MFLQLFLRFPSSRASQGAPKASLNPQLNPPKASLNLGLDFHRLLMPKLPQHGPNIDQKPTPKSSTLPRVCAPPWQAYRARRSRGCRRAAARGATRRVAAARGRRRRGRRSCCMEPRDRVEIRKCGGRSAAAAQAAAHAIMASSHTGSERATVRSDGVTRRVRRVRGRGR